MPLLTAPHPQTLFSLVACNPRTEAVVRHPQNAHLVSSLDPGELGLNIGPYRSHTGDKNNLAVLGRGNGVDVFVDDPAVSKTQCAFEIDPDSNVVMLYDRSHGQSTQVHGPNAMPFEHGRPRKIVVRPGLNTFFGMGGVNRDLLLFELIWPPSSGDDQRKDTIRNREGAVLLHPPRLAPTVVDVADTVLHSQRQTRFHTPRTLSKIRHRADDVPLGAGNYGTVFRTINVDTGVEMAVKVMTIPSPDRRIALKREVEILSACRHEHIVEYLGHQENTETKIVEIFMGLGTGSLDSLVLSLTPQQPCVPTPITVRKIAGDVFAQMIKALDFLAVKGIVHRDIKPENIIYVARQGQYIFQLGDFGLSNFQETASSRSGTEIYMAPEMEGGIQTHKLDVWALFGTLVWIMNVAGFRNKARYFQTADDARREIVSATVDSDFQIIQEMARVDPEERASAAQMLVKLFDGKGLTTPRCSIAPISPSRISPSRADVTQPQYSQNSDGQLGGPPYRNGGISAAQPAGRRELRGRVVEYNLPY